ncbi:MAG: metalloregulator ArsR/SmtB family transcription factor [Clostridia bacterium]|nr:metalloregulator ArsR/SmtB family transcription factor [Clostridia bacterium]
MTINGKESMIYMLSALAEPIRIRILLLIAENGEICAKDIQANFNITQPTMSHHMTVLAERNLVESHKEGRNIYYSINKSNINLIRDMLYELTIPPIVITNDSVKEKIVKQNKKTVDIKVNGATLKKKASVPKPKNSIEVPNIEEMKKNKKKKGDKKKKEKDSKKKKK